MSEEDTKNLMHESNENEAKKEITNTLIKYNNQAAEDGKQMNNFLGPMMKELEDAIAEQMKYLDKIEQDLLGDSKLEEYNRLINHIPEEIRGSKSILTVLKKLGTVLNETVEDENVSAELIEKSIKDYIESKKYDKVEMVKTQELIRLAGFCSNLCSFLLCKYSHKNTKKIKLFTSKIYDSVNLWISKLFRFKNSALLFYDDETDGIVRLCNMLMNYKFNDFKENGYESIKKKPLIYISGASKYATKSNSEMLAIQMGLPINCFKVLEVSTNLDDTFEKIDTRKFENNVDEDIKNNFIPFVLITSAGNQRSGHCDNLNELNRICYKYRIWLHLDGFHLSTLALYSVPTAVQPIWSGDSVTLDLATWLGIPCLSYITIYRNVDNSGTFIKPFNNYKTILQRSFPYWCILQAMGHDGVIERIRFSNEMSKNFNAILEKQQPCLKALSFCITEGSQASTSFNGLSDLFVKALNFLTFVDLNNPVTIFKCDPKFVDERLILKKDMSEPKPKRILSPHHQEFLDLIHENSNQKEEAVVHSDEIIEYTDSLTTWLFESINHKHNMEFELLKIENEGACIRYCPIDHVNVLNTTNNDLNQFSNLLEQMMAIIDGSIRCRAKFDQEVKIYSNLVSVKVSNWEGVGAVRYIPDYLMHKLDEIKFFFKNKCENSGDLDKKDELEREIFVKEIKEINDLNELIIEKLQSEDNAFSPGKATDGYLSIKFGMIQDIGLLKKILEQVINTSKEIEESSRFIETMSDLVRQGIEKANQDLKKETEQKLGQEGILRQIPLVGGLFSWISPSSSVNNVGRSFNLQSGKILTTETLYKYHIQVEENINESHQNNDKENSDLERELSSDTVKINYSNQISEISSEEQINEPDRNSENLIDLK